MKLGICRIQGIGKLLHQVPGKVSGGVGVFLVQPKELTRPELKHLRFLG